MYLQSIKSVKHYSAKSVNRSILKKSLHIGFGVFIVHSSMMRPVWAGCANILLIQDSHTQTEIEKKIVEGYDDKGAVRKKEKLKRERLFFSYKISDKKM